MPITTNITLSDDGNGSAVLVDGRLTGDKDRAVTVQAIPKSGYRFKEWQVETYPIDLQVFDVVANSPVSTVAEVCNTLYRSANYDGYNRTSSDFQNVARELFTDGFALFVDSEGKTLAPTGYWGAGGGTYYYWNGGRIPTLEVCSSTTTTTTTTTTTGTGNPPPPTTTDTGAPRRNIDDRTNRDLEPQ